MHEATTFKLLYLLSGYVHLDGSYPLTRHSTVSGQRNKATYRYVSFCNKMGCDARSVLILRFV